MAEVVRIGSASSGDTTAIAAVLSANLAERGLFQETANRITRHVSDFLVARNANGQIIGCASVHRDRSGLAQLHSVAVLPEYQNTGVGQQLVVAAITLAASTGVRRLWLATMMPKYFSRHGFHSMSRWQLPLLILLRQLGKTVRQPPARIPAAFFGGHTFMERRF